MKEAQIFENWVNSIMEGTWALPDTPEAQAKLDELMSQELIIGPDATNAKEQLYDVIGDDKLFDILADLADQDPRANCWDDTDVQARLQELGIQMNTTPDAEQQQPVAPAAGQQAPGTAPEQGMAEGQLDSVRDKLGNQGYISTQQDRLQNMQQYQDEKAARHQSNLRRRDNYDRFHDAQTQHDIDVMAHSLGRMSKNDDDWEKTFDMMRDRINRFQSSTQSGVDPEQLKKITNIKYKPNKKPSNQSVAEGLGGGVDATNPAIRKRGMAENTELIAMLKYAGVPLKESVLTDSTGHTLDHILKRFGREVADFEAGAELDNDLFDALYDYYFDDMPYGVKKARTGDPHEWISDRLADELGITESNSGMIMPEGNPIATVEAMPELSAPVLEGTCNATMEGEYCPEHGLAECGMYEMGTVAGGMAPVIGEAPQDPINYNGAITGAYYESKSDTALLARIKSLALLR